MNKVSEHKLKFISALILITLMFVLGCGSKQSPTGGKEDIEKLKVLASLPVEFEEISDQKIEVTFSKVIDKAAFIKGLYLYPPVKAKKYIYDGNIVTIKFLEALQADTNYYLTLTTRIKDVRGNALDENQTLVFRHGVMQSNRISGNIIYENPSDIDLPVQVNLVTPDSIWVMAKVFKGRSYALDAMNPMDYILRAYIDKNLNGRYDAEMEPYTESSLKSNPVISHDLNMAYADTVLPAIRSVRAISNREYEIVLNKSIKSYKDVKVEYLQQKENLRVFALNHNLDRIVILTSETDTTKYRFTVSDLTDAKGNTNPRSSVTIAGSKEQDKTAPEITSSLPRNGASVNNLQPVIEINFSEIIPSSTFAASLKETDSNKSIPIRILSSNQKTYRLQPEKPLTNYKSCLLTIESRTSDLSGNKLKETYKLVFLPIIRDAEAKSLPK